MPIQTARGGARRPARHSSPVRGRAGRGMVVLLAIALATACTTVTYQSYRPVQNPNVDVLYVGDGADFSQYKKLMLQDMGIYFPTGARPDEADLDRVRKAFRDAFTDRVRKYDLVERPGNDVLKIQGSLVDLRAASADDIPDLGTDLNRILAPGKLTFLIEMRDSRTNRLLLRAADTEKSPIFDLPPGADADEVHAAAEHWAVLFSNFLEQNLGKGATDNS